MEDGIMNKSITSTVKETMKKKQNIKTKQQNDNIQFEEEKG